MIETQAASSSGAFFRIYAASPRTGDVQHIAHPFPPTQL
jgi:hypothetical protein